jgi:tetrahydromethanopterin S-methyltransferase subunit D
VPVGLGTLLGALLLLYGTVLILCVDPDSADKPMILVGKILLPCGVTLLAGGLFVFVAEKRQRPPTEMAPSGKFSTPKWAYAFAGVCIVVGILGGFIGGICGFGGAAICVGFSRNQAISVPRRIYACILTVGFTWVVYFAVASQFFAAISSTNH